MSKNRETTRIVERKKVGASKHSQVTVSVNFVPQQTATDKSKPAIDKAKAMAKK